MTAAPPSRSMDVTRMLVMMQKMKNVMCAGLPHRASAISHPISKPPCWRASTPATTRKATACTGQRCISLFDAAVA